MIFKLREYQSEAKTGIRNLFSTGKNKVILCLPTGGGKTVTFADMARDTVANGLKVMIIVDRKELLTQAKSKLLSYGLNPQLITAGTKEIKNAMSYIATVQTLVRRNFPDVDLLIVDEAHKQIFDKIVNRPEYKNSFVIGATATPYRTGKMNQLSSLYDEIVETVSINDLIQQGFLVPAITYGAKLDTSKIKVKGSDYDKGELFDAFNKRTLYAGVVDKYMKLAKGTKAICFNVNVEHSKKVVEAFTAQGISAVHLDGKTAKKDRERILKQFSKGVFSVLCNCDVLTAGFDEWTVETIIVNLATKSLTKWLQMGGRGARITPKEFEGLAGYLQKTHFNLIDMGGNVFTHGFWEQERTYNLTHKRREKTEAAPVKTCPEDKKDERNFHGCGAILHASVPTCKFCNYIFPKKKAEAKEAEFIQLENYEFLPEELVGKSWGSMTIEELEIVRTKRGYRLGWIVKQILLNRDLKLFDYAVIRDFKNPDAWVDRMEKLHLRRDFYYYKHDESDSVWKQRKEDKTPHREFYEIDKDTYLKLLKETNKTDGDHMIFEPK